MRYWHPFSDAAVRAVQAWNPDEIILLPLYPQYSTTTTGSSLTAWREAAARAGLAKPVSTLCCYPTDRGFLAATAAIVRRSYTEARVALDPAIGLRVLFSAHGLPEVIVRKGDPYQCQVEQTVAGVVRHLGICDLDHRVCYQSRATPQKWLAPSTEEEIERAAKDKVALLVVPIAFVSEHSETLVELDIEYRHLAKKLGVPGYYRVPAQNADAGFITALADLVRHGLAAGPGLHSVSGSRECPEAHRDCPFARAGRVPAPAEMVALAA
jgi:ferrochelatase